MKIACLFYLMLLLNARLQILAWGLSSMHNYNMHMRRVSKSRYCVSSDRHVGRYSMHNDGTVSGREHRKTNNCIEECTNNKKLKIHTSKKNNRTTPWIPTWSPTVHVLLTGPDDA